MRSRHGGMQPAMQIRPAAAPDLPDIQAIYAHHVLTGTGTFEEVPPSVEEITARHAAVVAHGWSWLVAADASGVLGYGYYAQLRPRSAYRFSAEDSVYVRPDVRGQGVGKALVTALLAHAEAAGFRQMFAVIGDSENVGSIGLHVSLGFRQVGQLRSAGLKFGRWLDSITMQRPLGAGDADIPA
jgi:phosphinothricin acetyltransferase